MGSLPSSSEGRDAFALLHPAVQRWVYEQGWPELRPIQAKSIPAILNREGDTIIAAATAGGKTEAAFLPVVSAIAEETKPGFKALYVSPLKALINDQWRRLDGLCERVEIPVHKWHGDVSASAKQKARSKPSGIVLITPESLEAMLVRRSMEIPKLFGDLRYVVVDEFHAFIGSERGVQLVSLLNRLEALTGRRVPRVGLSATLGDMRAAAAHLRPDDPEGVVVVATEGGGQDLRIKVMAYVPEPVPDGAPSAPSVTERITKELFKLRGAHNLVFGGSRNNVELYADRLRAQCEGMSLPNEFFPHHGSLSRDIREEVEQRLRDGQMPTTVVCTTTLELGIDIGAVETVAQIGPPRSIASLRQRLGRSGRRPGQPAILRIHVPEDGVDAGDHPFDRLRTDVFQAVAAVRLLVERWYEPPERRALHLSTLLHQALALIAQRGGASARWLYSSLCGPGPFEGVTPQLFAALLRAMGDPSRALIEQGPDGLLMLGREGERLVDHYGFFAVFETQEEYRIAHAGRVLGTVPVDTPLAPDSYVVFAGRRWRVLGVDNPARLITVEPAGAGKPPSFGGGDGGGMHDRLVAEMRAVYEDGKALGVLNPTGIDLFNQGRQAYQDLGLSHTGILAAGDRVLLLPWVGAKKLETLSLALKMRGFKTLRFEIGVEVNDALPTQVVKALHDIALGTPPDPMALAAMVSNKATYKFDGFLTEELLCADFASRWLEPESVKEVAAKLVGASQSGSLLK